MKPIPIKLKLIPAYFVSVTEKQNWLFFPPTNYFQENHYYTLSQSYDPGIHL